MTTRRATPQRVTPFPAQETENKAASGWASFIHEIRSRFVARNPVLVRLLAICTVLGATTALKNGLLLSAAALAVAVPLYLLMMLVEKLPGIYRLPLAMLTAGALVTPVVMLAGQYAPAVTASCGVFLPMTAVNAVLMYSAEETKGRRAAAAAGASLGDVLGYSAVVLLISVLREIFGSGSVYGRALPSYAQVHFSFMLLPPCAFLLLGFALAIVQAVKLGREKKKSGGETK
jgi:electron transport complex protein RnfE